MFFKLFNILVKKFRFSPIVPSLRPIAQIFSDTVSCLLILDMCVYQKYIYFKFVSSWGRLAQLGEHSPTNPTIRVRFRAKPKIGIEERFLASMAIKLCNNPFIKIITQKNTWMRKSTKNNWTKSGLYMISTERKGKQLK